MLRKLPKVLKEISRDLVALGSIPFFFIVVVRATIGAHKLFIYQLIVAAALLFLLSFIIKKANHHIARSFVIFVFSSLYYRDALFTLFAFLLWLSAFASLFYLKERAPSIIKGTILGIVSSVLSYYLSPMALSALNL